MLYATGEGSFSAGGTRPSWACARPARQAKHAFHVNDNTSNACHMELQPWSCTAPTMTWARVLCGQVPG